MENSFKGGQYYLRMNGNKLMLIWWEIQTED
jgi:hypothetical protein